MTSRLQILNWNEAASEVANVNPCLAKLIDGISPSKHYKLYKVSYRFGDEILKNGSLYLPDEDGQLAPLSSHEFDKQLKLDLNYNLGANPVSLVLNNSVELFINIKKRIIPFSLFPAGKIFGLWRLLDKEPSNCPLTYFWGMTAGARSIFMLPKISDTLSHNRIKKQLKINASLPKHLQDHWEIFKEIATQNEFSNNQPWTAELLFFSKEWFQNFKDNPWKEFHRYLLESAWNSSSFWRNQFMWQLIFSMIQSTHRLKSQAYIMDLIQHVFMVSVEALPGFSPATTEIAGPISTLQNAYIHFYNLKKYDPVIMQPAFFSGGNSHSSAVYLSLQYPTAIELAPKFSVRTNALADLATMQLLISEYKKALLDKQFNIGKTSLSHLPEYVEYDFFHSDPNNYKDIRESIEIPSEDHSFQYTASQRFPADSPFFKGCIRIATKTK